MSLTHARALLDIAPQVHAHEPAREAAALIALVHWANRLAPIVEPDPPDGLLMDLTGCTRLYRGDRRMMRTITGSIERLGFTLRSALAPTVGGAWALARFGDADRVIVPAEHLAEAVAPLPIAALRIDEPTRAALHEVAVDRIGDVWKLPRQQLAARFGSPLLQRLDQLLHGDREPLHSAPPRVAPVAQRIFPSPVVQADALAITVSELLAELAGLLRAQRIGVDELVLQLDRYAAPPVEHTLTLSHPTADADHLWRLLRDPLERMNMGDGVEAVRLTTRRTRLMPHDQGPLWTTDASGVRGGDESLSRFIDRLAARLGADRVCRFDAVETYAPHAAFVRRLWHEPAPPGSLTAAILDQDRPSILFDPPRPIRVAMLAPDGPVMWLNSVEADQAEPSRIVTTVGPLRLAGRWWLLPDPSIAPPTRDYFKLQDEAGRWWWVFRQLETNRWFLHGQWA